jgi:hypothetical protein
MLAPNNREAWLLNTPPSGVLDRHAWEDQLMTDSKDWLGFPEFRGFKTVESVDRLEAACAMLPRDAREQAFSRRMIVLVNESAKKLALVGEQAADGSVPVEVFEIIDGWVYPTD